VDSELPLLWTRAGWFLAFVSAVVLPSPTLYFYYKDTRSDTGTRLTGTSTAAESDGFEENPLSTPGQSDVYDVEGSELPNVQPAQVKLAKMQREAKNMRSQLQKLQTEGTAKDNEILSLKVIATTKDESTKVQALQAQNAALQAQLAQVGHKPALPALNDNPPLQQAVAKTQQVAIRELAADEILSDQTRDSAKLALDELAAAQVKQSTSIAKKMVLRSEEMTNYLESLRLLHYADAVIRVAGMWVDEWHPYELCGPRPVILRHDSD
jgi:hypothetical protein